MVLTIVPPDGVRKDPLRSISVNLVAVVLFFALAEVVFLRPVSTAFLFLLGMIDRRVHKQVKYKALKLKCSCCFLKI